jgi:spore germination protein YaaH
MQSQNLSVTNEQTMNVPSSVRYYPKYNFSLLVSSTKEVKVEGKKAQVIAELSRSNFISMLKGDPPAPSTAKAPQESSEKGETLTLTSSSKKDQKVSSNAPEKLEASWGALKDTYVTDKALALKVCPTPPYTFLS